jgi:hypothetical protein
MSPQNTNNYNANSNMNDNMNMNMVMIGGRRRRRRSEGSDVDLGDLLHDVLCKSFRSSEKENGGLNRVMAKMSLLAAALEMSGRFPQVLTGNYVLELWEKQKQKCKFDE